jgi:hypothetical protein
MGMSNLIPGWAIEAYPMNNKWDVVAFFIDKEEAETFKIIFDEAYPNMDTRVEKKRAVIVNEQ